MVESTMGLKKVFVAPVGADGVMPAHGSTWKDFGDVYKETCSLKDSDPDVTKHESETSNKVITLCGKHQTTVELTLMDPNLETLAEYFGGTVTGSTGAKKWTRPAVLVPVQKAVWLQPQEGLLVGCANATIIPKFEISYTAKGICLVPIKIEFNSELVADQSNASPTGTQSA